jgi:tetratricopeptide (TPR) repeat protein
VDQIIRTCRLTLLTAILVATPIAAKDTETSNETDLYWKAQRAELIGQPGEALKSYNRLIGKLPESAVAVDRLFDAAITHGDFPSALKAARAQELANSGDGAMPLVFFVDAWRRGDWAGAEQATRSVEERNIFAFIAPILDAWVAVAKGKPGAISNVALRESGLLNYYANDQLVFLDLANNNIDSAQRRLSSFPGFGDDYARHMALVAAEHLGRNKQSEHANSLLHHIGVEPNSFPEKPAAFPAGQALSALFSRLSDQLEEQSIGDQSLYFARLAYWVAPESVYGRMTLSDRLAQRGMTAQATTLLNGVTETRPQWSWALGNKARILLAQGNDDEALGMIRLARAARPDATDLTLLEAQQLEAKKDLGGAAALYRTLIANAEASGAKNGRALTFRVLLAQALSAQSDWPGAKATLEVALSLNGENVQVLNMLGYGLLEDREDIKRGLELVSKAHKLAPQSAAITDSLGWGHYLNGDYAAAVPLLEQAVEGAINDVTINEHLGDAYWQAGREIHARYAWRSALLQAEGGQARRIEAKIDLGWTDANVAR